MSSDDDVSIKSDGIRHQTQLDDKDQGGLFGSGSEDEGSLYAPTLVQNFVGADSLTQDWKRRD